MAKKTKTQEEAWELLAYKIGDEGFGYALIDYSDWKEIKDEEFHRLKNDFEKSKKLLHKYIAKNVELMDED